jgi:hypothetical protein
MDVISGALAAAGSSFGPPPEKWSALNYVF